MHLRPKPLPFSGKAPSKSLDTRLFRTLEDSLRALNPNPSSTSFSHLSGILEILSSAHHLLEDLFSDDNLSNEALTCSYLHSSIELLDLCNELSRQINKVRHGRLLILYSVQLLSSPDILSLYKARDIIQQWESFVTKNTISVDLTRNLVHAALTMLEEFAGEALGNLREDLSCFSHGDVSEEITEIVRSSLHEIGGVEKKTAAKLAAAAERLASELDTLGAAAVSLFRAVIGARNAALKSYRVQKTRCYGKYWGRGIFLRAY